MRAWGILFLTVTLVSHTSAGGLDVFEGLQGSISIAGGTAHLPIMYELKHQIEGFNPKILVLVRDGGSSFGIEQVGKGLIDIGNAGRPLKPTEQSRYDLRGVPLAIDAIAVVVHRSNPVSNLTVDTLRKIYSGEITNWKQAGGDDRPISLYDRNAGSGTRSVFLKRLMPEQPPSASARIITDHDKMKVVVFWDRNAIGYMSIGHVDEAKVKTVALDGVIPTLAGAPPEAYPLTRKIYMYIPADTARVSELTRRFVAYVRSPGGARIVRHNGYIPAE